MKLLAILVGARSTPSCLDAATAAAGALRGATVEALHVLVDPDRIVASSDEIEFQRMRLLDEGSARERAAAVRSAFESWSETAGDGAPPIAWKTVIGPEEEVVCQEAEQADVIVLVLAREANMDGGDALHAALLRSGKPVLVVPGAWHGARKGFAHVAVGVSDSEVTRHAIAGAGPWLRAAARVTAIRIGDEQGAARSLNQLLGEYGKEPALRVVARGGGDLGAQIVAEAKAAGADLLVTGAYRHARLIEWLLGGTTRHLLAAADLPLLLAH
jgi:nucleotide-binding universal stress UspA family protein